MARCLTLEKGHLSVCALEMFIFLCVYSYWPDIRLLEKAPVQCVYSYWPDICPLEKAPVQFVYSYTAWPDVCPLKKGLSARE